jgi:hypothetical protein
MNGLPINFIFTFPIESLSKYTLHTYWGALSTLNGGFWSSFLAGKAVINVGASHYGVWKGNIGRDMRITPADYFSKTSTPLLALQGSDEGT